MTSSIPRWKKLDRLSSVVAVAGVVVFAAAATLYDIAREMHDQQIAEDALKESAKTDGV